MKLQKLVDSVLELQEELCLNIVVYDQAIWHISGGELSINTDGRKSDLLYGDGNTYNWEVGQYRESEDGYGIFYDADNGCGTRDTLIVRMENKIEY